MISYSKVTVQEVQAEVANNIARYNLLHYVFSVVLATLEDLNGKKITKRFGSIMELALVKYHVHYQHEKSFDNYSMLIWGNDIKYDSRIDIDLKHTNGVYDHKATLERYSSYVDLGKDAKRLTALRPLIPKVVSRYNNAFDDFEDAVERIRSLGVTVQIY